MSIVAINQLQQTFAKQGIDVVYIKHLSKKQDNDKNQIYLGTGFDGVLNLFPAVSATRSASKSTKKRASSAGKPKIELRLRFAWLTPDGALYEAPQTKLINYFQYPEVRLSGFLKGCKAAPRALRRKEQATFRQRILALGVRADGLVIGMVLTGKHDPIVKSFPDLPQLPGARILRVLLVDAAIGITPKEKILKDISAVTKGAWHPGRILTKDGLKPFRANQGAGYTLEALLGIKANALKAPDLYGFEIKTYAKSNISLMTPTPDGGYQGKNTFRNFMMKYGRDAKKNDGSRRFTGPFKCGATHKAHKLTLIVRGYDESEDKFGDPKDISVDLVHTITGEVIASWSVTQLAASWNTKHASAIYIRYKKRTPSTSLVEYNYEKCLLIGEGTDIWRLLRAIHNGYVFYDPADSIGSDGKSHVRPQWRIKPSKLKNTLEHLYAEVSDDCLII